MNAVAAKMGGAVRHLRQFVRHLAAGRAAQHCFFIATNDDTQLDVQAKNVHVVRLPERRRLVRFWVDQVEIPRLASARRCQALLSLLNHGPIGRSVPQVVLERNSLYFWHAYSQFADLRETAGIWLRSQLAFWTMRSSDIVVVPSAAMRSMIQARYPSLPRELFRVVPHPFEPESVRPVSACPPQLRKALDERKPGTVRLLYVSHFSAHKGIDVLLEATKRLADAGASVELLVTAERSESRYVPLKGRVLIEHLVNVGCLRFLGQVPQTEIGHVYREADLFVFPSLMESFGYPMLEARASGLPILAADTAINREMGGPAARFYPPMDSAALTRSFAQAAADPAGLRAWREAAQAAAEAMNHVSTATYVTLLTGLLEEAATANR